MKKKAMAAFLTLGLLTCAAGTNAWGQESIPRMRDYVWPEGLKVLRLEDGNYNHQMTVLDYELFNVMEILPRLWGGISLQSRDNDGDGYAESLQYTSEDWGGCAIKDTNGDGYVDYAIVIEMPQPGEFGNFQMEWTDNDENGTLDTIQIKYNAMIDGDEYAITGLWGDCRVLNQEYSEFDYDNEGRIRYIQLVTVNTENDLGEQQFFRDGDGDGYADQMEVRRFYDTDDDGVSESMGVFTDNDMDGVFEEEYRYDGTFDADLWE